MHIRFRGLLAAILLAGAGTAQALTVDEIVARHIEARGGMDRIKAIQASVTTGTMSFSGDFAVELALVTYAERPDRLRNEASLQGLTQVQAYDGKEGWQIQPFGGRKDPEKLSADDVKGLADSADMDGPLVDWRAKGHQVEYLGTEDVDGTEAHKLKVTQRNGDIKYIYLDPDYFLQIRETVTRTVRGAEQRFETDMGNYEQVASVYMPFAYESGAAGGPKNQKITVQKIEVNVPVDDALFAFPSAPATPAQ